MTTKKCGCGAFLKVVWDTAAELFRIQCSSATCTKKKVA